ncbi:MAG: putative transporter transrane protein [Acidimicrobiales bacterium]|nr:putative transporter transrane protein [Acidimicrobiales bacterium]
MAAITLDTRTVAPVRPTTILDTFKAEWTKLRTLRSTWYTVGGSVLISVALASLICVATVAQWDKMSASQRADFDPTSTALIGVLFAACILGSLAVRAITSEYTSGMIRVTFTAIPGRKGVLVAKAAILAAIAIPVALATNVVSFFIGSRILATKDISMSLSQPGVTKAIVFGAVAVSAVTVIGLGLGGIIRRTAGATTALLLAIMGSQIFGLALPAGARQYLPGSALQAVTAVQHTAGLLSPAKGLAVMIAYAVVTVAVASRLIANRDA